MHVHSNACLASTLCVTEHSVKFTSYERDNINNTNNLLLICVLGFLFRPSLLHLAMDERHMLFDLLHSEDESAFLAALPMFVGAIDLDTLVDHDGCTLFMACGPGELEPAKALIQAGADSSAGRWTRIDPTAGCGRATCVSYHPLWFEASGVHDNDVEALLRVEYVEFLLGLVSSGRLELPSPCRCIRLDSASAKMMHVAALYARRSYDEGLSRQLREHSHRPESRLPRDLWMQVILPYVSSGSPLSVS